MLFRNYNEKEVIEHIHEVYQTVGKVSGAIKKNVANFLDALLGTFNSSFTLPNTAALSPDFETLVTDSWNAALGTVLNVTGGVVSNTLGRLPGGKPAAAELNALFSTGARHLFEQAR